MWAIWEQGTLWNSFLGQHKGAIQGRSQGWEFAPSLAQGLTQGGAGALLSCTEPAAPLLLQIYIYSLHLYLFLNESMLGGFRAAGVQPRNTRAPGLESFPPVRITEVSFLSPVQTSKPGLGASLNGAFVQSPGAEPAQPRRALTEGMGVPTSSWGLGHLNPARNPAGS